MNSEYLAAIDIGTNSFHLIVVKLKEDGTFEIVDREKEVIRLSFESRDMKHISPEAEARAIAALKTFKGIADSYKAEIRAVATSAVRESHNRNEFKQNVHNNTGIEIEIISGMEEARLIYMGMLKALPIYDKKVLCIDIGGGSVEFLAGHKENVHYANSLKLGAVRLTQMFFPDFEVSKQKAERCEKWVEGELYPVVKAVQEEGFEICVGSSGTIMAAALMILAARTKELPQTMILNNFTFTRQELNRITETVLKAKTPKERKEIPGLDEKRADIIPAGMIVLSKIMEAFKLKELTVSGYALREGIVVDAVKKKSPDTGSLRLKDVRYDSVRQLAENCLFDRKHCAHVAGLALQLFDSAGPIPGIDEKCREYLEAAARLHDIGYHIAHSRHHIHSYYIIRNSELLGFSDPEIEIIAHTARYHRKSHPKKTHNDFDALPEKLQYTVRVLASFLRIADSLDRTHQTFVQSVKIKNGGKSADLIIEYGGEEPSIELWSLERRKGLYEETFGKKLNPVLVKNGAKHEVLSIAGK